MSFAPGGQSVLSASNDGVARVWHASGSEQALIPLYQNLAGLSLNPHELTVLGTLHGMSTLYFVRLPGGQVQSRWRLGRDRTAATLSPDGRLLATLPNGPQLPPASLTAPPPGPPKGPVRIWNVAQRRLVAVVHPAQPAGGVTFSQDDRWLGLLEGGTANSPGTPALVNIATGHTVTPQGTSRMPCLGGNTNDYAMSRNDRVIAIGTFCGEVGLWDATTGRPLRRLDQGAEISAVDLNPDGSRLLVASWDSRATIYDVATGRPLVNLIGHTRGIAWGGFAAGGSLVMTESLDHTVRVWNAGTGQQLRVLTFTDNQGGPVAFSPNGQEMAIPDNVPQLGVSGVVRVFGTCPACQNPKALLALAQPHAAPANRLTVLERTVINGS
jgi:WD40 repeat protein